MTKAKVKNKYIGTHRLLVKKGYDISYSVVYNTLKNWESVNHDSPQTRLIFETYNEYLVQYEKKAEANFQKLKAINHDN